MAPDPGQIATAQRLLRASQGPFVAKPRLPILDEVVATVLSQHTSDLNSERAFAQLKAAFPDWEQVLDAPAVQVADAIRCGGIADAKSRRIQQILAAIRAREGRVDLGRLHDLDDAAVEEYLTSLPGVGPKTAACVLVFSMGRGGLPRRHPRAPHRDPARLDLAEDHRREGAPDPRPGGAARYPLRPAHRADRARAHGVQGAAAALR